MSGMVSVISKPPSWELVRPFASSGVVAGIDEVGRGAWAGPLTVAVVALPFGQAIDGVRDSKLLSHAQRCRLDKVIRRLATGIGIGWVSAAEIDQNGLSWAVRAAGFRALADLEMTADLIILDGNWNYLAEAGKPVQTIVKADATIVPVAAASVLAKVARDRYMEQLEHNNPLYGFAKHRGYVTAAHRQMVAEHDLGPHHRRLWTLKGANSVD